MRVPRVFVGGARVGPRQVAGADVFQHLVVVLRRGAGDRVIVYDGDGASFDGAIAEVDRERRRVLIDITAAIQCASAPVVPLTVAVGVPKGDALEVALRIASEAGLAVLQPLITSRTVARVRPDSAKFTRWQRIATESSKQCGRAVPLTIRAPLHAEEFFALSLPAGRGWIALPGAPLPEDSGLLEAFAARAVDGSELFVAIGPEGGFTPAEVDRALAAGFSPVGFPTPTLRTPTAVAYVAALGSLTPAQGDFL